MGEQRKRAAGPGEHTGRTAPLPDLTDVDLRTLRAMDDPVLMAAVDQLLRDPREFREVWYVGEDPVGGGDVSGGRTFPAGLTRAVQGEESQG